MGERELTMNAIRTVIRTVHTVETHLHNRVTKVHVYGGTAGVLFLLDTAEGHILYGVGVMVLAYIDLRDEHPKF